MFNTFKAIEINFFIAVKLAMFAEGMLCISNNIPECRNCTSLNNESIRYVLSYPLLPYSCICSSILLIYSSSAH